MANLWLDLKGPILHRRHPRRQRRDHLAAGRHSRDR